MLKKPSTEGESGSLLTRVTHKHELAMVRAEGMKGWEEATGENAHAPRVGEALTSPLRFPHRAGRCFISLLTWDIPGVRNGLAKWDPVASHSSESHTEHRDADPNPPALAVSYFQSLLSSPQALEPGLRWGMWVSKLLFPHMHKCLSKRAPRN